MRLQIVWGFRLWAFLVLIVLGKCAKEERSGVLLFSGNSVENVPQKCSLGDLECREWPRGALPGHLDSDGQLDDAIVARPSYSMKFNETQQQRAMQLRDKNVTKEASKPQRSSSLEILKKRCYQYRLGKRTHISTLAQLVRLPHNLISSRIISS